MAFRNFYWKIKDFLQTDDRKFANIIAARDGNLYEVYEHGIGRLVRKSAQVKELDPLQEGFQFGLPKIPGQLLSIIISFFRAYCSLDEQNEVLVQVFYDTQEKRYFLECPEQFVSKGRVEVVDWDLSKDQRYIQVMQIHSHNTMQAFFSGTDDANETAFMLYGVVGRMDKSLPDVLFRVGYRGRFITNLPIDGLFDRANLQETVPFPQEWHARVHDLSEILQWRG